jgi:hypothetical protein
MSLEPLALLRLLVTVADSHGFNVLDFCHRPNSRAGRRLGLRGGTGAHVEFASIRPQGPLLGHSGLVRITHRHTASVVW